MLLSSTETINFLEKLNKMASRKILYALQNNLSQNKYLELDVYFFMDGVMAELIKYFREQSDYSLDELNTNFKKWFDKIF